MSPSRALPRPEVRRSSPSWPAPPSPDRPALCWASTPSTDWPSWVPGSSSGCSCPRRRWRSRGDERHWLPPVSRLHRRGHADRGVDRHRPPAVIVEWEGWLAVALGAVAAFLRAAPLDEHPAPLLSHRQKRDRRRVGPGGEAEDEHRLAPAGGRGEVDDLAQLGLTQLGPRSHLLLTGPGADGGAGQAAVPGRRRGGDGRSGGCRRLRGRHAALDLPPTDPPVARPGAGLGRRWRRRRRGPGRSR